MTGNCAQNYTSIVCRYAHELFRALDTGWGVVKYSEKESSKTLTAVGTDLPTQRGLVFELFGEWAFNKKGQKQFEVAYYDIVHQEDKDCIIAYLLSLKCGIGNSRAKEIYAKFGNKTWDIIDNDPYRLSEVKGVSTATVDKLLSKQVSSLQIRNILELSTKSGANLSPTQIHKIIERHKEESTTALKDNPYSFVGFEGITFDKADAIGLFLGFPQDFPPRLQAFLPHLFGEYAAKGHVCIPKNDIRDSNGKLLYRGIITEMTRYLGCTEGQCRAAVNAAWKDGEIKLANDLVYSKSSFETEGKVVANLHRLMSSEYEPITQIDTLIEDYEAQKFPLAENQIKAIKNVFKNQVSIITGGPGTGKTTVTKAVLYVHKMVFGESSNAILLAPTGKAARRLSEATGYPAQTIHSAVGYRNEKDPCDPEIELQGNLIIIDESSMMDQQIASILFDKIQDGAKVVILGDPDQLPSVGAGNVLHDLIESGSIPTIKLDVIYRQSDQNPIVTNAHLMNTGCSELEYARTFKFLETQSNAETFDIACSMYLRSVKAYGIDNVVLLNPQRNNTDLSVSAFNKKLQEVLHEHNNMLGLTKEGAYTMQINGITYRVGDKIMQLKNTEIAKNGDTGFIRDIIRRPDPEDPERYMYEAIIEFNGDGYLHSYPAEEMKNIDLAYCSTVHKSQGEEYQTVIMVVSKAHPTMLKRNIVYTGITRAKENVALVGELDALKIAIENGIPEHRFTLLAQRMRSHKRYG